MKFIDEHREVFGVEPICRVHHRCRLLAATYGEHDDIRDEHDIGKFCQIGILRLRQLPTLAV